MVNQTARRTVGTLLSLHALTGVHWGAGTSLGTVDLPIQRERHTGWPNGAGSALKGVLRDACREALLTEHHGDRNQANESESVKRLFGSAKTGSEDTNAGALSVTDARLLAMPVRSLKGVFAWVTCPAVLERLDRDASIAGIQGPLSTLSPAEKHAYAAKDCPLVVSSKYLQLDDETLTVQEGADTTSVATWIVEHLLPGTDAYATTRARFVKQMVIVPDNVFTHFTKYATEVVARIGLDYQTKTVKDGALFYQELLPAESLMYSVVLVNDARSGIESAKGVDLMSKFQKLLAGIDMLQVGGDETTGKGFCAIHFASGGV